MESRQGKGRVEDKVVLITGAARGMGKSHAERFAEEGADVIALGLDSDSMGDTVKAVEATGRKCLSVKADVTQPDQVEAAVAGAYEELGRLDIVCTNAGVVGSRDFRVWEIPEDEWKAVVDVNLNGVQATLRAAVPRIIEGGRGGSVHLIGSTTCFAGYGKTGQYTAAKMGVVGILRVLANELGEYSIRVNAVHPTFVDTPMIHAPGMYEMYGTSSREEFEAALTQAHILPIPMVEARDISNALLWLSSDEARYVTGVSLPIDGGATEKT
jgi:NAD(P)-dependent dehydrogenase (short-subunit alcohol dehydrogenase family)